MEIKSRTPKAEYKSSGRTILEKLAHWQGTREISGGDGGNNLRWWNVELNKEVDVDVLYNM